MGLGVWGEAASASGGHGRAAGGGARPGGDLVLCGGFGWWACGLGDACPAGGDRGHGWVACAASVDGAGGGPEADRRVGGAGVWRGVGLGGLPALGQKQIRPWPYPDVEETCRKGQGLCPNLTPVLVIPRQSGGGSLACGSVPD